MTRQAPRFCSSKISFSRKLIPLNSINLGSYPRQALPIQGLQGMIPPRLCLSFFRRPVTYNRPS
jgi:hypothetical protein